MIAVLCLALTSFWLLVHGSNWALRALDSRPILPLARQTRTSSIRFTLRTLWLRVETTGFNTSHHALSGRIHRARANDTLVIFYDLGIVVCCFGMLGILGTILWTSWLSLPSYTQSATSLLQKRGVARIPSEKEGSHLFKPIVSNLTSLVFSLIQILSDTRLDSADDTFSSCYPCSCLCSVGPRRWPCSRSCIVSVATS